MYQNNYLGRKRPSQEGHQGDICRYYPESNNPASGDWRYRGYAPPDREVDYQEAYIDRSREYYRGGLKRSFSSPSDDYNGSSAERKSTRFEAKIAPRTCLESNDPIILMGGKLKIHPSKFINRSPPSTSSAMTSTTPSPSSGNIHSNACESKISSEKPTLISNESAINTAIPQEVKSMREVYNAAALMTEVLAPLSSLRHSCVRPEGEVKEVEERVRYYCEYALQSLGLRLPVACVITAEKQEAREKSIIEAGAVEEATQVVAPSDASAELHRMESGVDTSPLSVTCGDSYVSESTGGEEKTPLKLRVDLSTIVSPVKPRKWDVRPPAPPSRSVQITRPPPPPARPPASSPPTQRVRPRHFDVAPSGEQVSGSSSSGTQHRLSRFSPPVPHANTDFSSLRPPPPPLPHHGFNSNNYNSYRGNNFMAKHVAVSTLVGGGHERDFISPLKTSR